MINQKFFKKVLIILGVSALLLSQSSDAHARRRYHGHHGHHGYHGYHYYDSALVISGLFDFIDVNVSTYPYYYDDYYYIEKPRDYIVIKDPTYQVVEIPKAVEIVQDKKQKETSVDSFVVNIPNAKGGYTPVTIKRSGEGFVGPQGEFYPEFPKVKQLKVMYAK